MKIGDRIETPRFSGVRIADILTAEEAKEQGYTEPTHYRNDPVYDILGKSTDMYHMVFAAVKKPASR